jgi:8-oxo-dGTP pyrophosphatase MutT (NUDIX family)
MGEKGAISAIVGIVDTVARSTLVLRRFDGDREFPGQWCFPGGRAHPGEATDKVAVREAREETGLTVRRLEFLGRRESVGATGRIYLIDCFLTESWTGSLFTFPSAEHAAAAWVSLETLCDLAPAGATTRWLALTIWSRFRSSGQATGGPRSNRRGSDETRC